MIPLNRMVWKFFLLLFFILVIAPYPVFGDSKFKFNPLISIAGRYDSNFYLSEENEKEVYTLLISPGFQAGVESAKLKVDLSYFLEAYFYDDKSDVPEEKAAASDENYLGHLVILDAIYQPVEKLSLGINDSFYITRRPQESDRFSNSIEREKYWINRFTPLIFFNFNDRFSVGLRYRRTDIDYYDSDEDDSIEHRGILNIIYNPTRTVTLDLDYQRWTYNEPEDLENRKYTSDWIKLTAEKRYNYFSFEGGIGYHNRDFDDIRSEDQDIMAYKLAITAQNPPPEEGPRYLGRTYLRSKTHFYLAGEKNFNNLGDYFDMYTATRFTASAGHVLWDKIRATVRGYYQENDYIVFEGLTPEGNTETRLDKVTDVQGILEYLITKRMSVSLTVGNEKQDSNVAGYDYNNRYSELRFNFDYDVSTRGDFSEEASYYR